MKIERIEKIASGKYEGYIWESDQTSPKVFINEEYEGFDAHIVNNPFVIEGLLYSEEEKSSYSIKFVDGEYYCYKATSIDMSEIQTYLPNRMNKVKELKFVQNWELEEDPLCEGMKVQKPKGMIFVGLNKKED